MAIPTIAYITLGILLLRSSGGQSGGRTRAAPPVHGAVIAPATQLYQTRRPLLDDLTILHHYNTIALLEPMNMMRHKNHSSAALTKQTSDAALYETPADLSINSRQDVIEKEDVRPTIAGPRERNPCFLTA